MLEIWGWAYLVMCDRFENCKRFKGKFFLDCLFKPHWGEKSLCQLNRSL